jgi:hypothetical protein
VQMMLVIHRLVRHRSDPKCCFRIEHLLSQKDGVRKIKRKAFYSPIIKPFLLGERLWRGVPTLGLAKN